MPNAAGMFPLSQTGPGDLAGSTWDTTAVEGQQNFLEYVDHGEYYPGETEDYTLAFGQITPKQDQSDVVDELQDRWTSNGHWTLGTAEPKALKAEAMSRVASSKSSTTSHKSRAKASSKKTRARVQSILPSSQASQLSKLDMTGNYRENAHMLDEQQYIAGDLDTLSVSSQVTAPPFYSGMMAMGPDGLHYPSDMGAMAQHVNPQVFDLGLTSQSPQSWSSQSLSGSRNSSPGVPDGSAEDMWASGPPVLSPPDTLESSPPESYSSESPLMSGRVPRYVVTHDLPDPLAPSHMLDDSRMNEKLDSSSIAAVDDLSGNPIASNGDEFALPPSYGGARRLSGEGESARDHYLYKNAAPQADGLYHCPWEGQAHCNHKAEKLKCNYE